MLNSRRQGFSIAQVLLAAALVGGLSLIIAKLAQVSSQSSMKARESGSFASLRSLITPLKQDPRAWIATLRASSETASFMSTNLPEGGESSHCPPNDAAVTDSRLRALVPSDGALAAVPVVDIAGAPLAGTPTVGRFYDVNGLACVGETNANCRIKISSYVICENSTGNPGNVSIAFKIEPNKGSATASAQLTVAPVYEVVNLQTLWADTAEATCNGGFSGQDADGNAICYSANLNCGAGKMVSGWEMVGGKMQVVCTDIPKQYVEQCPAGKLATGFDANGKIICQ